MSTSLRLLARLITFALAVGATSASASLAPPVKVEVLPPAPGALPQPGQSIAITVRVTSAVAAGITGFDFDSPRTPGGPYAWTVGSLGIDPAVRTPLAPLTPLDIPCVLTAGDPDQPFVVEFLYEGQWVRNTFSLRPRVGDRALLKLDGTKSLPWVRERPLPRPRESYHRPDPAPSRRQAPAVGALSAEELAGDAKRTGGAKSEYDIRVRGRFVYFRPDGQKAGVDGATIRVMDEDTDWDDELTAFTTYPDGTFDYVFHYDADESPDIYLAIEAANGKVLLEDASVFEWDYAWESDVIDDTDADFFDYGEFTTGSADLAPALHILTTATRTYRWFWEANHGFSGIEQVEIQWPEDGNSTSQTSNYWDLIEITTEAQWRETTIAHEYNHHWAKYYSADAIDDYCNDPPRADQPGDCGHNLWCQESAADAWGEGFGDWVASSFVRRLEPDYGLEPVVTDAIDDGGARNVATLRTCGETFDYDDPWLVEGNFAALLLDIEDNDDEQAAYPYEGADELAVGRDEIIAVATQRLPLVPGAFLAWLMQDFPYTKRGLWNTANLNGFTGLDTSPPGVVTDLHSTSHSLAGDSSDDTITYAWTRAADDMSGVRGYCVLVTTSASAVPGYNFDLPDVFSYTTDHLGAGRWYFKIRAQDRAENWSPQYATYGPIEIRAPFSADVRPWPDTGWAQPLVPRPAADATASSVPSPTTLDGDAEATWYSLGVQNIGEGTASYGWQNTIYLDGQWQNLLSLPVNLPYPNYYKWLNRGPITVRGGRHTLSVFTDSNEANSEMNEFDNEFAKQWVWQPSTMIASLNYTRATPPDRYGGALSVPPIYSYNCDGMRTSSTSSYFQSVSIRADSLAADYDCRLHPEATTATGGFNMLYQNGWSSLPAGCLDAVFVNGDNAGSEVWDVGILNMNDHWCDYRITRHASSTMATGLPVTVSMGTSTYLALRQFQVVTKQGLTISLDSDPALGRLQMVWLDESFATGDLLDADGYAATDSTGHAEILVTLAAPGWHGLAVYRDPQDVPGHGSAPSIAPVVTIATTPSDLQPTCPTGWAYAFTPLPTDTGTDTSVPEPSYLTGDASATWFNYAWTNAGRSSTGSYQVRTYVDGGLRMSLGFVSLGVGGTVKWNSSSAVNIPAGRHTLALRLDPDGAVTEMSETNNNFARQWVWAPSELARRVPVTRSAPARPTAGWSDLPAAPDLVMDYNCDGVRLPAPAIINQHGWWQGVATMPGAASDVDVRVHEVVTGARLGFRSPRALSGWGTGQSDFVLVNHRATPARGFDVGVIGSDGAEPYTVEAVASTFLSAAPAGRYGPYTLGPQHILQLLEVTLPAGAIAIGLHELQGDVDWGLSLHSAELPYQAKLPAPDRDDWLAWMRRPGEGDWLVLDVPVAGNYCLAVWKVGAADLAKSGRFELEFTALSGAPEPEVPAATRLVSVRPNPFNPRTAVVFELAAAGRARIAVYDVEGRRVRDLLDAALPAGRREQVWDGCDDRGRPLASGVYLVRLETAAGTDRRAVTLVR